MSIITCFENVRLGSTFPSVIDVSPIFDHESRGIQAKIWTHRGDKDNFFQLRKQGDVVGLLCFISDEQEKHLPEFWFNSKVLWDSRPYREV